MVDLTKIRDILMDPSIRWVIWEMTVDEMRHGDWIIRHDGARERFWDFELLRPYLDAWRLRMVLN